MSDKILLFIKKAFYLFLVIFLWQNTSFGQHSGKPTLIAEKRETPENMDFDVSEYLYVLANNTAAKFDNQQKGLIAIRVCSSEPLPIALVYGSTIPLITTEKFRELLDHFRNNLPPEPKTEIYFLRSNKNCKSADKSTVQYWFVPKDADFPEFIEYKKLNDISINRLIYETFKLDDTELEFPFKMNKSLLDAEDDIDVNSEVFEVVKKKIAELLKQNKTTYLLIESPLSLKKKRKIIYPRAIELKTFLNKQGIGNHRIFLRDCSRCFYEMYQTKSKELYPKVTIIYQ